MRLPQTRASQFQKGINKKPESIKTVIITLPHKSFNFNVYSTQYGNNDNVYLFFILFLYYFLYYFFIIFLLFFILFLYYFLYFLYFLYFWREIFVFFFLIFYIFDEFFF